MTTLRISACLLVALALNSISRADIDTGQVTGGSATNVNNELGVGVFEQLFLPPLVNPVDGTNSVGFDNFQTNNLYGFNESQDVTLANDLLVDLLVNGQGGMEPGVLLAGTRVSSHYIFFDSKDFKIVQGFIRFEQDILAVITTEVSLGASDSFLGHVDVNYVSFSSFLRGLEAGDSVTLTGPREITVLLGTATPGDYIRVVTAVPEPSTLVMASVFAVFLVGGSRRRRKRSTSPA